MLDRELTICATTNEAGARMVGRMDGWKVLAVNKCPAAGVPDGSYLGFDLWGRRCVPQRREDGAVSVPYRRRNDVSNMSCKLLL